MANEKAPKTAETPDQVKNRLYGQATTVLRKNHTEEFQTILAGLYAGAGLTYNRRLTAQERAEKEIAERLALFPALRETFAPAAPDDTEVPDEEDIFA